MGERYMYIRFTLSLFAVFRKDVDKSSKGNLKKTGYRISVL